MSILVSGASGQIGSDLVRNLSKNFKIIAIFNTKKKIIKLKNVVWIKHNFAIHFPIFQERFRFFDVACRSAERNDSFARRRVVENGIVERGEFFIQFKTFQIFHV